MNEKIFNKEKEFQAVKVGDNIEINPLYGRKRKVILKGTQIDLLSNPNEKESLNRIIVPSHLNSHAHYRLTAEEKTYRLKVIAGPPFLLNGVWALDAYIFKGDQVNMLEAKFSFNNSLLIEDDEFTIDPMIIKSDLRVLITGETGTGKTRLARKIHDATLKSGPFISVNLSSFNPSLIESELFGHKKGSFTGAICDKIGAFKQANWGTLFLDEIDSLPLEIQTKLLCFLDDQVYRPVGENKEEKSNARLIFASGRPLEKLVEKGEFRRDFYYRLKSGHSINLVPLRDCVAKIDKALDSFCIENNLSMTQRLRDFYLTLSWPGNYRQLYGHLDKKRVFTNGRKLDFDFCDEELITQSSDLISIDHKFKSLEESKREYASKVLSHFQGNYSLAARKLLITEKTLKSLIKKAS